MPEVKFCFACGTPRVEGGRFCPSCGKAYADVKNVEQPQRNGAGSKQVLEEPVRHRPYMALTAFVILGMGLVFLLAQFLIAPKKAAVAAVAEHHHEGMLTPEESTKQIELEQKAKTGDPAAILDLTEFLIALSMKDPGQLEHASEWLSRVVTKHPNYGYGMRLLGNIYYQLRDPERASSYYKAYLELYPNDANVRTDYGSCLQARGDFNAALEAYKLAIASFPTFYHAHFNMALVYDNLGQKANAEEARRKAVEIDTRFGRLLAPENELPHLPLPDDAVAPYKPAAQPTVLQEPVSIERAQANVHPESSAQAQTSDAEEEPITLASLEAFFRGHSIMGPKMSGFEIKGDTAFVILHDFPMDQMPPNAREAFNKRIDAQMAILPKGSKLEIHDAATGRLMASFPK